LFINCLNIRRSSLALENKGRSILTCLCIFRKGGIKMSLAHFDDISEICYACEKQPLGKRQKRIGVWTEKEMRKPVEERVENQKVVALSR
jgi:hypothetical protein